MHECSKALPSAQDDFRSDRVERASKQANDGCGPPGPGPEPRPQQTAMEYFAKAMAELLGCRNCYVALISGSGLEEVRIGDAPTDPSCPTMVERFARKGTAEDVASLEPVNSRTSFVRKLIGAEPRSMVIRSLAGLRPVSAPLSYSWPDGGRPRLRQPRFPVWRIPCARYGRRLIQWPGKSRGMSMRRYGSKS